MADDDEPGSAHKVLLHFIREMSWSMLIALGLVGFMFFYGLINSLIKLSGRDVSTVDFPAGPVIGALSAGLLVAIAAILKLRQRD